MLTDDRWAYDRMQSHGDIHECTSFRCEIDGVVHRFVCPKNVREEQRWSSLCGLWPERCPPSIDVPVNCLGCIAEGG